MKIYRLEKLVILMFLRAGLEAGVMALGDGSLVLNKCCL